MLRCVPMSYVRVESRATNPSFDQEDAEDPEDTAPDNDFSKQVSCHSQPCRSHVDD
jgi:hypothetical protein